MIISVIRHTRGGVVASPEGAFAGFFALSGFLSSSPLRYYIIAGVRQTADGGRETNPPERLGAGSIERLTGGGVRDTDGITSRLSGAKSCGRGDLVAE